MAFLDDPRLVRRDVAVDVQGVDRAPVLDDLGLSAALATLAREAGDGPGPSGPIDVKVTGLRGMRKRAELLGGRVTVTSRPGAGTTVEAVVPIPGRRL